MSSDNQETERPAHEAKEGGGISRRKALLTLGLAGLAAYTAPSLLGLTEAEAGDRRWRRTSRHYRHRRRRRYTRTSRHYRHRRWYPYSHYRYRYHHYHRRPGFHLYIR